MTRPPISWGNVTVITVMHLLAAWGIVYLALHFSWWTAGLTLGWLIVCELSVTAGYHRLFAHPTYKAAGVVRAAFLFFGAASVQNSAIKWAADHRLHHAETDREADPYNAKLGFWWAHLFWNFYTDPAPVDMECVADLQRDPLIRLQERSYLPVAIFGGAIVPAALGLLWGDLLGALLCAGFLRVVLQWHLTWSINSVAHTVGRQPYSRSTTARDFWATAMLTFGEGYHNYHHRFPGDYRNGVRWYQFDPTKWLIWTLSKLGLARELRKIPAATIAHARAAAG